MWKTLTLTVILALSLCSASYGDAPVIKVWEWPLQDGISTSTVTANSADLMDETDVVTCPSVALRGRKELTIINMDDTDEVYLSNVTDATSMMRTGFPLFPYQTITIRASEDLHIYATANTAVPLRIIEIR